MLLAPLLQRERRQAALTCGSLDRSASRPPESHGALGDRVDVLAGLVRELVEQRMKLREVAADDVPVRLLVGGRQVGERGQALIEADHEYRAVLVVQARDGSAHDG